MVIFLVLPSLLVHLFSYILCNLNNVDDSELDLSVAIKIVAKYINFLQKYVIIFRVGCDICEVVKGKT